MRANETNYIESFRLMINLEEAAEETIVEKCSQTDVKLHHVDDNEFYFIVEVIGTWPFTNFDHHYYHCFNLKYLAENEGPIRTD